jgi:hypothetical protein
VRPRHLNRAADVHAHADSRDKRLGNPLLVMLGQRIRAANDSKHRIDAANGCFSAAATRRVEVAGIARCPQSA